MGSSTEAAERTPVGVREFVLRDAGFHRRLALALGAESVSVGSASRVVGGASREMWAFDAVVRGPGGHRASVPLIMRLDALAALLDSDSDAEVAVYSYVRERTAVPVPEVVLEVVQDPGLGMSYFVMSRIEGRARLLDLQRAEYAGVRRRIVSDALGMAGSLARHEPDVDALRGRVRMPDAEPPALTELRHWAAIIAGSGLSRPVTDMVVRHLERNPPPPPRRLALVHGDYRIGNILFTGDGLTGVVDWEMAHVGDPLEDLAWALAPAWRPRSAPDLVGGVLTESEATAAWAASAERKPDPAALAWWRLFSHVKANAIWMSGVGQFVSGATDDLVFGLFGWKNLGREERWMLEQLGWVTS
ncbi:phosphotransferase family protein [Streptomyces sp. NPDC090499]|uniref:phosphotransferase family protein n=1 Tax=unclassified Streptomyces TaxID=2593676 RepID=UPI00380D3C7D